MGQVTVLLKKNWTLRLRHSWAFLFETLFPIIIGVILVLSNGSKEKFSSKDLQQNEMSQNVDEMFFKRTTVKIYYHPKSHATDELMHIFKQKLVEGEIQALNSFKDIGKENLSMFDFSKLIEFQNAEGNELPKKLTYRLKTTNFEKIQPLKKYQYPFQSLKQENRFEKNDLYIQALIGKSVTEYWIKKKGFTPKFADLQLNISTFYIPPDERSSFIFLLAFYLPFCVLLSFVVTVSQNTKTLVVEKEIKLKEMLKIIGMSGFSHGLSWFLTFLSIIVPSLCVYVVLLVAPLYGDEPVLAVDWSVLTVLMCLFTLALTSYIFMISTFFSSANHAVILSFLLYFGGWVVSKALVSWDMPKVNKIGVAFVWQSALDQAFKEIIYAHAVGEPLGWSNLTISVHPRGVSLAELMAMFVVDTLLHCIVYWYISNVAPGDVGVSRPFYFPLTTTYWLGTDKIVFFGLSEPEPAQIPGKYFEQEPKNLKIGVEIDNLKKRFGPFYAVKGMSLNLYEGQITVLLGHNGAGKTTTMNMITGIFSPTSGTAIINGVDIRKRPTQARSSMGVCPQHDVLYPFLTVYEHLSLFAMLKGVPPEEVLDEVDRTAIEVELQHRLYTYSRNLSGGQKRKLSVGMALIGGSKVIILDEPTAGMDPTARRSMWGLLQRAREEGRTLLLSTHYMDEADTLGDRIAIMAGGRTICCGSSLFLKNLYGTGYKLVVTTSGAPDVSSLTNAMKSQIQNAKCVNVVNKEVVYTLPNEEKPNYHLLFRHLEQNKELLGIVSYGVTETTMEEVFLNAGDDIIDSKKSATGLTPMPSKQDASDPKKEVQKFTDINKGFDNLTGSWLVLSRMYGTFVKKAVDARRFPFMTLLHIGVPFLVMYAGVALIGAFQDDQAREITGGGSPVFHNNLEGYENLVIPFSKNASQLKLKKIYEKNVLRPGFESESTSDMTSWARAKASELGTLEFRKKVIIGMEVGEEGVVAYYSLNGYRSVFISMNYVLNTLLQFQFPDSEKKDYSLQSEIQYSRLIDKNAENVTQEGVDLAKTIGQGIVLSLFSVVAVSFLVTLTIRFLILERKTGAKHVQKLSGVGAFTYWLPTFAFDALFTISVSVGFVILIHLQDYGLLRDGRILILQLAFCLVLCAAIPSHYLFQFIFKSPTTAMIVGISHPVFTCIFPVYILTVIIWLQEGLGADPWRTNVAEMVFALIFPQYNLGKIIVLMSGNYLFHQLFGCEWDNCNEIAVWRHGANFAVLKDFCEKGLMNCPIPYTSFAPPGVGKFLTMMVVQGVLYSSLVLIIDSNITTTIHGWLLHKSDNGYIPEYAEDGDVAAERVKVQQLVSDPSQEAVLISNLTKYYGMHLVVDHISVAISHNDCFGLLGQNGAGKSTTFKMLTGEVVVSRGNAWLKGNSIVNHINEVQTNMGYCPQFDALIECMTGRETLRLYARLRGVPGKHVETVVTSLIDELMLSEYADLKCGGYSGGNKRKLSTAMSLVGNPAFILMDEPSAGMDPKARRQMWTILGQVRASGKTLILTSHSMEECDALCTKIVIMVNGRFVCLGSPQHLKSKFAQGYTVIVNLKKNEDGTSVPCEQVVDFVIKKFPGAKVFDVHQGFVHFQVPDRRVFVGDIFQAMELNKHNLMIDDYTVQQTTLEQVFMIFTKGQQLRRAINHSLLSCCVGKPRTVMEVKDEYSSTKDFMLTDRNKQTSPTPSSTDTSSVKSAGAPSHQSPISEKSSKPKSHGHHDTSKSSTSQDAKSQASHRPSTPTSHSAGMKRQKNLSTL